MRVSVASLLTAAFPENESGSSLGYDNEYSH
jgi:hypothetical protein